MTVFKGFYVDNVCKCRGKKKACEQSSQTNQHLLTPKKLYHEYKTLYIESDIFQLL